MPLVRIELFPGRSHAQKMEIAEAITRVLEETAGISPTATTVMFSEVAPSDWVVAGKPLGVLKD
ncbi:MAG TPA: 4-oxalocrotonate tautomerase family protein [Paracoccus solventivorans]|uniref:4-oxalocrotonate tautomerase family protein n=1 Tax=Paracoccus solventivorans TaxID=53463 RepID=A0A832PL17_9RHOB|nr:4-oxalocrotonate tautomerase family protein [Paracoccus solventivorans]HHW33232.1 4-oxalocrotonate tautomerase family protein [Paracoccus solventivorans]